MTDTEDVITAWAAVRAAIVDPYGLHELVDQLDQREARNLAAVLALVAAGLMTRRDPDAREQLPGLIGEHLLDLAQHPEGDTP